MSKLSIQTLLKLVKLDRKICQPLFEYCYINHFSHIKIYNKETYSGTSTHPSWSKFYLVNIINETVSLPVLSNYKIWHLSFDKTDDGKTISRKKSGISFFIKADDVIEIYSFSTFDKEHKHNFFLQQLDDFKQFILYYNEKINTSKKYNQYYQLQYPLKAELQITFNSDDKKSNLHPKKNYLQDALNVKRYYFGGDFGDIYFTPTEIHCLKLLLQRMTAKQVAQELNLSYRTVETHINHIKIKTQCQHIQELLGKIDKNSLAVTFLTNQ